MRHTATVAFLLLTSASSVAHAQSEADRSQARDLGEAAFVALDHKDWTRAEELFRRADALYHAPTLLLGLARAEKELGKVVEAWLNYHRILVEGPPPGATPQMLQAIRDASAEIGPVEQRRARVTIHITGPVQPKVTLDGEPVPIAALDDPRPINPGGHSLRVTGDGFLPKETKFTATEGQTVDMPLRLDVAAASPGVVSPRALSPEGGMPAPAKASSTGSLNTRRVLAIASIGAGAVGIVVGAVGGLEAIAKRGDLEKALCSGPCSSDPHYQDGRSTFFTWATVSTIGFIVGAIGVAGGAALWLTAPRTSSVPSAVVVAPMVGLWRVGAQVTF